MKKIMSFFIAKREIIIENLSKYCTISRGD